MPGSSFSFARTADTNAYAAGDVIGPATGSTAAQLLESVGPVNGPDIMITSVLLEIDASSLPSGMGGFQLALYSDTPPSAIGDNTSWDIASGDRPTFLGLVTLAAPTDVGSTLISSNDGINTQISATKGRLYAYLITSAGYTPVSATVYKVTLHTVEM